MEKDLATAVTTSEKYIADENNSDQDVQKKLEQLKQKYDLKVLKLVVDKQDENEETVHIHGEVNPNKDSKKIKRRKKVKKGTLIHEMSEGAWSEYSLRVTRVVNRHKFFAKAKGQSEKQFDNAGLDTTWKKYNPYKRGEAWEAIKDGSEWSNYADARQVLNYRKHNRFDNPAGKDWHHIVEQNNPFTSHSVKNLAIVDEYTNRSTFNIFFNAVYPETDGLPLRKWLPTQSEDVSKKWGKELFLKLENLLSKRMKVEVLIKKLNNYEKIYYPGCRVS